MTSRLHAPWNCPVPEQLKARIRYDSDVTPGAPDMWWMVLLSGYGVEVKQIQCGTCKNTYFVYPTMDGLEQMKAAERTRK